MGYKEKIQSRFDANIEILARLTVLAQSFPDQRFGQLIANYVFPNYREVDFFYEEPVDTLKKLDELIGMK